MNDTERDALAQAPHSLSAEEYARIMAKHYEPDLDWDKPAEYDLTDRTELVSAAEKILQRLAREGFIIQRVDDLALDEFDLPATSKWDPAEEDPIGPCSEECGWCSQEQKPPVVDKATEIRAVKRGLERSAETVADRIARAIAECRYKGAIANPLDYRQARAVLAALTPGRQEAVVEEDTTEWQYGIRQYNDYVWEVDLEDRPWTRESAFADVGEIKGGFVVRRRPGGRWAALSLDEKDVVDVFGVVRDNCTGRTDDGSSHRE